MDLFAAKSLLVLLSLVGCCAGQGILPAGPVEALLGSNVTLNTLVDKPVYSFITWSFIGGSAQVNVATVGPAGLKVSAPYQGRVSVNRTNGYLTLTALKSSDSGLYSIIILSADGDTQTADIRLRVLEPVSGVTIKSDLPDAIENNSTVVLNCSAKGSFLKFAWINGTAPIVADGKRLTLKEMDTSSTLTITGVLRSDLAGPIYCTAANNLETQKSAPFNLTVYYGPDEVTITPPKSPQYLKSGSNFSLTCSSRSSPPATYNWYHSEQLVEFTGATLTLGEIEKGGLGMKMEDYKCRAQNAKTQRVVSSPAVSFAVLKAISGATVTGPTATLIAGNSTANLSCQATAGTVVTRAWMKDGKPLSAGARLLFAEDMSSMVINLLQKEDNGEYTCELTSPIGTEKASYKMAVSYGPEPAMVTGGNNVEVEKNVNLTCSAASVPPANFTWKFNGTMTDVKTAVYVLQAAAFKDSGMYTCEAHNPVTGKTATYTHTLSIKAKGTVTEETPLSDGAIAGIVIAVLVALGAAVALIFYCRQKVPVESPY